MTARILGQPAELVGRSQLLGKAAARRTRRSARRTRRSARRTRRSARRTRRSARRTRRSARRTRRSARRTRRSARRTRRSARRTRRSARRTRVAVCRWARSRSARGAIPASVPKGRVPRIRAPSQPRSETKPARGSSSSPASVPKGRVPRGSGPRLNRGSKRTAPVSPCYTWVMPENGRRAEPEEPSPSSGARRAERDPYRRDVPGWGARGEFHSPRRVVLARPVERSFAGGKAERDTA